MPRHEKWDLLRKLNDLPVSIRSEELVSYTQGYILALEDVIQDISKVEEDDLGLFALDRVEQRVTESLENARDTLAALTRKKALDEVRVQRVQETGP